MASLTKKQRFLVSELEQIENLLLLRFRDIAGVPSRWREAHLERIRRHLIVGEVILQFTLLDEYLNVVLARHFFGHRPFPRLWRTKRFRNFNHYFLEPLATRDKLRYVKAIMPMPKALASDIEAVTNLRNSLAHAFFPENQKRSKPEWKGKSIFSVQGLEEFVEDMTAASRHFLAIRGVRSL